MTREYKIKKDRKYSSFLKIHLADGQNKDLPACKSRRQWAPFLFTDDYTKIDCVLCLKWVEAAERAVLRDIEAAKV